MKRTPWLSLMLCALLALTAAAAVIHLNTRTAVAEDALLIRVGDEETLLSLETLPWERVTGQVVNGRGEWKDIDADGLSLAALLPLADIDVEAVERLTARAADEYTADLSGDELRQMGKAYLIRRDDGLQMIVFGDENSRRNVREVQILEVALMAAEEGEPVDPAA